MPGCRLKPITLDVGLERKYLVRSRFNSNLAQKKLSPQKKVSSLSKEDLVKDLPFGKELVYSKEEIISLAGDSRPIEVEIACGTGDFLVALAKENQDKFFIGVDYALPCLQRAIKTAQGKNVENILFFYGTAHDFIENDFRNFTFDRIMINFPDPWPKKRHIKRRIINKNFLLSLWHQLADGASVISATDVYSLYLYHNSLFKYESLFKEAGSTDFNEIKKNYYSKISKYQKKNLSGSSKVFYTHFKK